jgi:PH domain
VNQTKPRTPSVPIMPAPSLPSTADTPVDPSQAQPPAEQQSTNTATTPSTAAPTSASSTTTYTSVSASSSDNAPLQVSLSLRSQPRVVSLIDQMLEGMPDPVDEDESGASSLFAAVDDEPEDVGELVDISLEEESVEAGAARGVIGWNSSSAPRPSGYYEADPQEAARATSPPVYLAHGKTKNIRAFAREQLTAEDERNMESLQVLKMGYLHKKGKKRRNWSKRLFVLRYSSLRYYKGTKVGGLHSVDMQFSAFQPRQCCRFSLSLSLSLGLSC